MMMVMTMVMITLYRILSALTAFSSVERRLMRAGKQFRHLLR